MRPVTLRDGWWRRGAGEPLLGRLSDEGNSPVALVPAKPDARRWSRPAYELRDPEGRKRPVDTGSPGRSLPQPGCSTGRLPDEPLGMSDLFRFSVSLRGLARELWMVLAMALLGAFFGLSIPIASGILVDQVIPEADLPGSP